MMDSMEIAWFRYRIGLRQPIVLAGSSLTEREGFVVRIRSDDGREGWGEAAPLPGFHGWFSEDHLVDWFHKVSVDPATYAARSTPPSIAFAMTSAQEWLTGSVVGRPGKLFTTFLVNREDRLEFSLQRAASFKSVKVKVGGDVQEDAAFIEFVRSAVSPETNIRADANRRWTVDEVLAFGKLVGPDALEFLEEPCGDPDSFGLIRTTTGLSIAADESIHEANDATTVDRILDAVDYLVLKPTMVGGLNRCRQLANQAYSRGSRVVVSSAYETGVGMRGLLFLINSLNRSDPAPGIGTYAVLAEDILAERLPIHQPEIDLSTALNIKEVNLASLERIV